jgi:predicted GNAT superfamily acetyltransferase
MSYSLRDLQPGDIDPVLDLNESVVPAVNSLARVDMEWFAAHAAYFRVAADNGDVGAFLIGLREGSSYASPNYRWFVAHYERFAYVDRVAVAPHARRLGLASALYDDFAARMKPAVAVLTCEVNLRPPNPGSMRFHEERGFRCVGRQETEGGGKEVALLELRL